MPSIYLKVALISFIIGIGILPLLSPLSANLVVIFLILTSILIFFLRKQKVLKLVFIALFFILISSLRIQLNQHTATTQTIDFYNDTKKKITFIGYICEEPDLRIDKGKYTICAQKIIFKNSIQKTQGKVLISLKRYPAYQYGDKLKLVGSLKTPVEFEDFSYRNYLSRYQIFSVMYTPQIQILEKNTGNLFYAKIFAWKKKLEDKISQIFTDPSSSFLAGLLIGSRRGIPENIMEAFNITGLTHIIAISGYNITIIIVFIMGMLSFLPRKISFYMALVGIVIFTIFVGASAAVVRAAIMGILGLIALQKGRQTDVTLSILITATLMIAYNPKILWYDVGFQLSFLAVLGLVYIAPFFEKWFEKIPQTLGLREALMMTLAAQVTAVPIILLNFERLSLIAPLANILVAPFIPLAMLFGFIAVLISFLSLNLSLFFGFFAYIFLEIILIVAKFLAKVPWASVEVENISVFIVVFYYLLLTFFVYKKTKK